ncbi:hypothetical protein HN018_00760 [Lichenicola cladoniae]|uniref:ABC transmembrane type-1 domain-containing protein n=1 Tax=Lichenicola cladoniae TaxID=1484109 RepID=A0A6M8HL23_9PROT|nr:hypothetical protein [Lichenicola cladoniae]NPD65174.1 hypothetical protein [Acetobacteraceae bacterium]QKE88775.1 hypothetical protein HN018_00760 [Lichenicola cladoniae]
MILRRLSSVIIASTACLVTAPLLRFLLIPLVPWFGLGMAPPVGDGPGLGNAAANSVLLAGLAVLCALPPALWFGFMLERRAWSGRGALIGVLWLVFLLPGYLVAAGWQIVLGTHLLPLPASLALDLHAALLGWPGLVGITTLKGLPVATLAARSGWSSSRRELREATLLHVATRRQRLLLNLRLVLPAIAPGLLIVFVESTQDYGVASVLGSRLHRPLLVTEVYASLANWPISWPRAAWAADLLVGIALLPLLARLVLPGLGSGTQVREGRVALARASLVQNVFGWLALAILLLLGAGVPLLALAGDALTPDTSTMPAGAWRSLLIAALYAFVASVSALGLASFLVAQRRASPFWRLLTWLPVANMAVPGIVVAAAYVIAFNGPPLPLTNTPLALLLAETATQMPVLALLLLEPVRSRLASSGDVARVHGIPLSTRIERIYLPPLLRPLAWAWALAFCRLFFELPLAQMLAPAGAEPVAVVLVQMQQGLHFGSEARLALIGMLSCGVLVGLVLLLAERSR